MSRFVKSFDSWVSSGEPLDKLIETLSPFYEPWRAQMIAVTETTRAYANGNIEFWKSTGVVSGYDWVIANDSDVCPTCVAMKENGPYPLEKEAPPAHVNCRCAVRPVLNR